MPSLQDNIVLFLLALLLFGPKRLPKLAREIGKWVGEFRRASADFRMQMEDELRVTEQAEKQKKIDELVAANPAADPAKIPEPEHPHLPATEPAADVLPATESQATAEAEASSQPIASSGVLNMMPPATGLPQGRSPQATRSTAEPTDALGDLMEAIPVTESVATEETAHHG